MSAKGGPRFCLAHPSAFILRRVPLPRQRANSYLPTLFWGSGNGTFYISLEK